MFGIGFQEMLIILVVVLIFFGPKRLPDLAKSIGKGIAEFKKASEEVRQGIQEAMKEETTSASGSEATAKETTGPDASVKEVPEPYEAATGEPPPASPAPAAESSAKAASGAQEPPPRPG